MEYLLITRKGNKITEQEVTREDAVRMTMVFSGVYKLDASGFLKDIRNNKQCAFAYSAGDFEIAVVAK